MEAEEPRFLLAQMWRDDIRNIDIVDATEEGCSNDHQYKHESKKENNILIGSVKMISNTGDKMKSALTSSCHQSSSLWRSAEFPKTHGLAGCTPAV